MSNQRFHHRALRAVPVVLLLAATGYTARPASGTSGATGTVSGTVFRDTNANGVHDAIEPGQGSVTARAFDIGGDVVGQTTSNADGTFTINVKSAKSTALRVEFSDLPDGLASGPQGPGSESTVQFVTLGAITADLGVANPAEFCQSNPTVAISCSHFGSVVGSNADEPAIKTFQAGAVGDWTGTVPATFGQLGTTYGLASDRSGGWFASSFVKRHAGLAAAPGTIFHIGADGSTTQLVTLDAGTDTHPATGAPADVWMRDVATWDAVGKSGLGDLDLSQDATALFTVNLADRKIYRIALADPAVPASADIPIPAGCANDDWRPFAVAVHDAAVLVGGVCTNQSTQVADDHFAATVYQTDDTFSSFTSILTVPLAPAALPRKCADEAFNNSAGDNANSDAACTAIRADWSPWLPTAAPTGFTGFADPQTPGHNSPWLTDLALDASGNLALGFRSRFGDQMGNGTYAPAGTDTARYFGVGAGDVLKACQSGSVWTLESNGSCGGVAGAGVGNHEGPGGGEFYNGDKASTVVFGKSNGLGDLDAMCDQAPIQLGNRIWLDVNRNGVQDADESGLAGVNVELWTGKAKVGSVTTSADGTYLFGGLWNTGIVEGVAVLPHTAYAIKVPAASGAARQPALDGLQLTETDDAIASLGGSDLSDSDARLQGTTAVIALTTGGPGHNDHTFDVGFVPATVSLGNRVWDDRNDDGVAEETEPGVGGVTVTLFDATRSTEVPVGPDGILGTADDATGGTTTNADGYYLFTSLRPGTYVVEISNIPAGYRSSADPTSGADANNHVDGDDNGRGIGGGSIRSNPVSVGVGTAPTGEPLTIGYLDPTNDDSSDLTVDFGLFRGAPAAREYVSLGNRVYIDLNDNGVHDGGEPGLGGVCVKLLAADGTQVIVGSDGAAGTADDGAAGGSCVLTDQDGYYLFSHLDPGTYIVEISNLSDGYRSATDASTSADAGNGVDGDDNGLGIGTGAIRSNPVGLAVGKAPNGEPATPGHADDASDANSNLTIDFGVFHSGPAIDIIKYTNGVDADTAAEAVRVTAGAQVVWTYGVSNVGNVTLTRVKVVDDREGAISCPKDTLAPGEQMTCSKAGRAAVGPYANVGTVTGIDPKAPASSVTAADPSHYFGDAVVGGVQLPRTGTSTYRMVLIAGWLVWAGSMMLRFTRRWMIVA